METYFSRYMPTVFVAILGCLGVLDVQVAAAEIEQRPRVGFACPEVDDASEVERVVTGFDDPLEIADDVCQRRIEDGQAARALGVGSVAEGGPR